jgi:hypothetical protein
MREVAATMGAANRIAATLQQVMPFIHAKGLSGTVIWPVLAPTTALGTNGRTVRGIGAETREVMTEAESIVVTEIEIETGTGGVTGMSRV